MGIDYTPIHGDYKDLGAFRFWCQKILPMVYDDSLSYYETLGKLTNYLNDVIGNLNTMGVDVTNLHQAYVMLQGWVNHYFDNLDVQNEINNKLNTMASDGSLSVLIRPMFDAYKVQIDTDIAGQNASIAELMQANGVLSARMDTFTSLPEGSTTGDAEIADARVGYNGVTYSSLGKTVREQFSLVQRELDKNELISKNLFNLSTFRRGTTVNKGNFGENPTWGCSDYIPIKPNTPYTMSYGWIQAIDFFDSDKQYISFDQVDSHMKPYTTTSPQNAAYAVVNVPLTSDLITPEIYMFVEGTEIPAVYVPYGMNYEPIYRIIRENIGRKWEGKSIVTFGDSITWYDGKTFYDSHSEAGQMVIGYQSYMRELLGCNTDNQGRSGHRMPDLLPYIKSYNYSNVDGVTLTIGANDFRTGTERVGEILPIGSAFDETTFYGSIQSAVEHILNAKPTVKLYLITPIKGWSGTDGSMEMPVEYPNAIKEIGKLYSLPVCDWYAESGINSLTKSVYIGDIPAVAGYYLHPTNAGFERMGHKLVSFLENN